MKKCTKEFLLFLFLNYLFAGPGLYKNIQGDLVKIRILVM